MPAQLLAQFADLLFEVGGLRDATQDRLDPVEVDRLHQVIGGAPAQGRDRAVERGVTGDHDHLGLVARVELAEQIDPLAVREPEVREDDVRTLAPELDPRRAQ